MPTIAERLRDASRAAARAVIDRVGEGRSEKALATTKKLLQTLRDQRQFEVLDEVAGSLAPAVADDPTVVKLHAQSLIDRGKTAEALERLGKLAGRLAAGAPELTEARGLMGRACKQAFFDAANKHAPGARDAIAQSLAHYRQAYDGAQDGGVWPGLNLLALVTFAQREGIDAGAGLDPRALALKLLSALDATPPANRDTWYHASRAEAYLGLDDLDAVEMHVGAYVRSEQTTAFALGGTLRQFTELWKLDQQGERGHGIVQALRAALLKDKAQGHIEMPANDIYQSLSGPRPTDAQLQKILGAGGTITYAWLMQGLTMARSVGVIRHAEAGRIGTGFLVRGGDLVPVLGDERIVVTNEHVIGNPPQGSAVAHDEATITFEAVDPTRSYGFSEVYWQSDRKLLDCTLLRLTEQPAGIEPLKLAKDLPPMPRAENAAAKPPRVFVIGYPGGRDLAFSLQDNELLDHEAPPDGTPPVPDVCRVHYHAPTEPGSSGSPVFNTSLWRVIALHHAGDDKGLPRLNGKPDTWPANEGIWIQSVVKAVRAAKGGG